MKKKISLFAAAVMLFGWTFVSAPKAFAIILKDKSILGEGYPPAPRPKPDEKPVADRIELIYFDAQGNRHVFTLADLDGKTPEALAAVADDVAKTPARAKLFGFDDSAVRKWAESNNGQITAMLKVVRERRISVSCDLNSCENLNELASKAAAASRTNQAVSKKIAWLHELRDELLKSINK